MLENILAVMTDGFETVESIALKLPPDRNLAYHKAVVSWELCQALATGKVEARLAQNGERTEFVKVFRKANKDA